MLGPYSDFGRKSPYKSRVSADFKCLVDETGRFLFGSNDAEQDTDELCCRE